jgi:hypothetical protein
MGQHFTSSGLSGVADAKVGEEVKEGVDDSIGTVDEEV